MDLIRLPLIGSFLRWRHARLSLQLAVAAAALAIVVHGLLGPQIGPRNLSTVVTSIHWRGLLILAILAVGNAFCTACPMVLARDAGRRLVTPRRRWPRALRRKWLGLGLLVAVLFSYELFGLWEQPSATAWLVLGAFGLALAVDLTFSGASFCKYVCPVGQFNFIASTVSPTEVRIRDAATCGTCRTYDCIKGRRSASVPARIEQRGCELGLFLPMKTGNLDCTLCLDCVHACPHDNVAVATRAPAIEWLATARRSGIGRVVQRRDLAVLAAVFVFGALLNAFAMTAPARDAQRWVTAVTGVDSEALALASIFVAGLVVLPLVLLSGTTAISRLFSGAPPGGSLLATPFIYALVPLGAGVWAAHYGFHFLTGALTIVPVTQSAAVDLLGRAPLGEPDWTWLGMRSGSVFPIQLGLVLLGWAGSLGLIQSTAHVEHPARPASASAAWLVLSAVLAAAAVWILAQPMDMRGISTAG